MLICNYNNKALKDIVIRTYFYMIIQLGIKNKHKNNDQLHESRIVLYLKRIVFINYLLNREVSKRILPQDCKKHFILDLLICTQWLTKRFMWRK